MFGKMKRVSIAGLAQILKVSKTLVSLVMNGRGDAYGISAATQKRVLAKAKELNYRPNLFAKSLRSGKTNVIGLIIPDISNSFYSRITKRIEEEFRKHGFQLMTCSSEENPKNEQQLIEMLVDEYKVEGIIVASAQNSPDQFNNLSKNGIPIVLIDRTISKLKADYVGVDNFKGAFQATEHLIKTGRKKIALLAISPDFLSTICERKQGYVAALKKNKIKHSARLIIDIPFDNIRQAVEETLKKLIITSNGIDAILTLNNSITSCVLDVLHSKGLNIPEDLSLISFDDLEYFSLINPTITAVAQPLDDIGIHAVEFMMNRLDKKGKQKPPKKNILPVKLIIRNSSKSRKKSGK
ncbi:LacI family DNA-binding transcriptional regulator [soil metagenome]